MHRNAIACNAEIGQDAEITCIFNPLRSALHLSASLRWRPLSPPCRPFPSRSDNISYFNDITGRSVRWVQIRIHFIHVRRHPASFDSLFRRAGIDHATHSRRAGRCEFDHMDCRSGTGRRVWPDHPEIRVDGRSPCSGCTMTDCKGCSVAPKDDAVACSVRRAGGPISSISVRISIRPFPSGVLRRLRS